MTDRVESEITPALTPEEWEGGETAWPVVALETTTGGAVRVSDMTLIAASVTVPDEYRHALAALALHGQPFGFEHDMVRCIRHMADLHEEEYRRVTGRESPIAQTVRVAADNIEALLPPRE